MQKMKRWKRNRGRWGQREGEKKAERHRELKKEDAASERQQCQQRGTVVFRCMSSVGLPPVSMRQMQPGALGNYRGEPPSEHMCFPLANLHKDSTWPVWFSTFHLYLNNRHKKEKEKKNRTAAHKVYQNCGYVEAPLCFLRVNETHFRWQFLPFFKNFLRSASLRNIPLFSVSGAFTVVSYRVEFSSSRASFSTGVCGCHSRRAASCKLLISLRTQDSPSHLIESAYTCNHMLQPSDRSIPSPTGRDTLSPSAGPPCPLNIVFRYSWT